MRWERLRTGVYASDIIWGEGPERYRSGRYYLIEKKRTADPRQWHLFERDSDHAPSDSSRRSRTEWFPTATLAEAKAVAAAWEAGEY